jgi:ribonucleotide reductase alpha subunit
LRDFRLSEKFLEQYVNKKVNWIYGDLGYSTFKRSYARFINEDHNERTEEWWECVRRVVEGVFSVQKKYCAEHGLEWINQRGQKSAQIMYDKIFNFKFTPPGRGLAVMGSPVVDIKGSACLQNCAFTSTKNLHLNFTEPFEFLMDMSMCGAGVGFDTRGAGKAIIQEPGKNGSTLVIDDSREGWVDAMRATLESYRGGPRYKLDYSKIRAKGEPIKTFGGKAPGPEPLRKLCEENIPSILDKRIGEEITSVDIVELMNFIGICVVTGNVRRSAELAIGNFEDKDYVEMKNFKLFPKELDSHRWMSNNSVLAEVGADYSGIAEHIAANGEPGVIWMDNVHSFGRHIDGFDDTDEAEGFNPCITSDTWITTDQGPKQVSELIGKKFNAVLNGKIYTSTQNGFWETGVRDVYQIDTIEGFSIKATENHKFRTADGEWKEVCDLSPGDKLAVNQHAEWHQDPAGDEGTYGEGYVLGLITGDGTFVKENKLHRERAVLSVWQHGGYTGIVDHVCNCFSEWKFTQIKGRNELRIRKEQLDGICIRWGLNHNKDLGQIEKAHAHMATGFLKGIFDADGSVQGSQEKGCSVRLTAVREDHLEVVQRMLLRKGVYSRIYRNRREQSKRRLPDGKGGYKLYNTQSIHELIIANTSLQRFAERVGFEDTKKRDKLNQLIANYKREPNQDRFIGTVSAVTLISEDVVYDCTINDSHAFDANGFVSHNCVEQPEEDREMCTLVENYPGNHDSAEEFIETLKYSYLYAKTVTLIPTHNKKSNQVMMKNRRIGSSMSGIEQAIAKFGKRAFFEEFCDAGYAAIRNWDRVYSNWLGVPRSVRVTTVKPSGTVSLLAGASPGIHKPQGKRYIRYVGWDRDHALIPVFKKAGYIVEEKIRNKGDEELLVLFPVEEKRAFRYTEEETNIWEQFQMAADMQHWWSDNGVSCTIKFDPNTETAQIEDCLVTYEDRLKAISLLPKSGHGFKQAPYTLVSDSYGKEDRYLDKHRIIWTDEEFEHYRDSIDSKLFRKEAAKVSAEAEGERYCSNETCTVGN